MLELSIAPSSNSGPNIPHGFLSLSKGQVRQNLGEINIVPTDLASLIWVKFMSLTGL